MFALLIVPVWIYTSRTVLTQIIIYPSYKGYVFVHAGWVGAIVLTVLAAMAYTTGQITGLIKPRHRSLLILLPAAIGAIAIAKVAPVLPTAEQNYFYQHRDEFFQKVTLIKQGQTISEPENFGTFNHSLYISKSPTVIVFDYGAYNFYSEYAFVYAENVSDTDESPACSWRDPRGPGQLYAQLSANWYLCYRTGDDNINYGRS